MKSLFHYRTLMDFVFIGLLHHLLMFLVLISSSLLLTQADAASLSKSDLEENTYAQVYNKGNTKSNSICNTKECIRSAANFLHSMDTTVDPCENFYHYTCGNWHKEHPAPRIFDDNDWFAERNLVALRRVEAFLKQNNTKSEPKPVHQARDMFKACINLNYILEEDALTPLNKIMKNLGLSSIPPFEFKAKRLTVTNTLALINRLLGKIYFIGISVYPNPLNSTENIITVNSEDFDSLRTMYRENEDLENELKKRIDYFVHQKALGDYITLTMKYLLKQNNLNVFKYDGSVYEATEQIINLKYYYSEVYVKGYRSYSSQNLPELMTLDKLQEITDLVAFSDGQKPITKIFWKEYLENLFWKIKTKPITGQTKISISTVTLKNLRTISKLLATTPVKSILLTLWWEVVNFLNQHSTNYLREIYLDFVIKVLGKYRLLTRPLECSSIITKSLMYAVGYSSADKEFLQKTKNEVQTMINNIQQSSLKKINNSKWLDKKTKAVVKDKSKSMKKFIGLPKWLLQKKSIEKYYKGLRINEETHLENLLGIIESNKKKMLLKLNTVNDYASARSDYNPVVVNAYYDSRVNSIIVPAGILQYPFYKLGLRALEYGAVGTIIGHEFTHPFDTKGRQYDKYGQFKESWTNISIARYTERMDCFVQQYNSYFVKDVGQYVSGELTLTENVADNGGILASFMAYKKLIKKHGREKSLPGLTNYTNEQLFFLSFANMWCAIYSEDRMLMSLQRVHSPGHIRVLGSLSNLPQFSRAWSCPKGAKMNPKKKCQLW